MLPPPPPRLKPPPRPVRSMKLSLPSSPSRIRSSSVRHPQARDATAVAIAPPGGESLKDTAERVVPFYESWILPKLKQGSNIILVAHGNSLRSLIMQLDQLTPETVMDVEIGTALPLIYRFNADGTVAEKRDLAA